MRFMLTLAALAFAGLAVAAPYRDGDTVVFFGDSITHGGQYHAYLTAFYRTRYPDANVRFVNSGIGGDTASGAFKRISVDVAEYAPTHVAVHFGMNDIGRGNYLALTTPESLMRRENAQTAYRANLKRLVKELRRVVPKAKLTYLTPTHYEDTAVITNAPKNWSGWASVNNVGCNVGLSLMAGHVLAAAKADGAEAVDWYSPLNNFIARRRAEDPSVMLTRVDRVHPGPLGHSLMAWAFLRQQGVDSVVSEVSLDAASGRALSVSNAVVSSVAKTADGIAFDLTAKSLPFPVPAEVLPYVAEYEVERNLNRETVAVSGLADGAYVLKIDGAEVGVYAADDFRKGVSLGFNAKTPQYRQAQAVLARVEQLRRREAELRNHHSARWFYGQRGAPVDDVTAFADWFEKKVPNKGEYFAGFVPGYLAYWPTYRETRAKLWEDQQTVRSLAQPVCRHYEIVREMSF